MNDAAPDITDLLALARQLGLAIHYRDFAEDIAISIGRELTASEREAVADEIEGYDEWADNSSIHDADAEYESQLRERLGIHGPDDE